MVKKCVKMAEAGGGGGIYKLAENSKFRYPELVVRHVACRTKKPVTVNLRCQVIDVVSFKL